MLRKQLIRDATINVSAFIARSFQLFGKIEISSMQLCWECLAGAQIIFPESGRGLGHVTPTIFSIRSNMSLKLLQLETSNLIHGFVWAMPSRRTNKFP